MKIVLLGAIFGEITHTYDMISRNYGSVDWVISTGNFGVWPDPIRADKASRKAPGEFLDYLVGKRDIPIPTLMIAGKHEDHIWLERKINLREGELIYNLHYLVSGNHTFIESNDCNVKIVGIGGTYSPKPKRGNYTTADIQKACTAGPMDIVLSHEAPDQEVFGRFTSAAKGINKVCFATQPKLLVSGKIDLTKSYRTKQTGHPALNLGHRAMRLLVIENDEYRIV